MSYTELEFDEATAAGIPRLVFLLADGAGIPAALTDADRTAVQGFRQRLLDAGLVVREFTSDTGLELEVFHALAEILRAAADPAPGVAVRYSLPPGTVAFTGRDDELASIAATVPADTRSNQPVAVHAIGGTPGVGKTALAVHAARRLAGRFPGRCLFIDLHAHTPGRDPVAPETALAGLLMARGADGRFLPADLAGLAGLWRDRTAGERLLLVLDNAASSSQVIPLLPAGDGSLVLVTSRRHLGDLPGAVVPLELESLPPEQAREMFTRLVPRAAADPGAVADLVALAGFLPLAISLLARVYARHRSWTLRDLIAETRAGLLTLSAEEASIAAVLEVSRRYLSPSEQQFFGLMGLHLGTTIDAYAAAALAGVPLEEATDLLDSLHREGLVIETGYRRYGMHDLVRRYARDRAAADPATDRDQALGRLLDYYQHTAAITQERLARRPLIRSAQASRRTPPAEIPDLADRRSALTWSRTERSNLLGCLDYADRTSQYSRVVALTAVIGAGLRLDGLWADAMARYTTARQAARHTGDRAAEADILNHRGDLLRMTGDYRAAAAALEDALRIFQDLGHRTGEANALTSLGSVRYFMDDYPGAKQMLEAAHTIYRDLHSLQGQADALAELGAVLPLTGDYPGATTALLDALRIFRDIGDPYGQANALNYLGVVRRLTGDYPGAAEALQEALSLFEEVGSRSGQATALTELGAVRPLAGDAAGAVSALEGALGIIRDMGDRPGEAVALGFLGVAQQLTGDHLAAAGTLETALRIFRDLGDRGGQANALNDLGAAHRLGGDLNRASTCHRQALDLAREIESEWDEAHALAGLGRCALAAGYIADAEMRLREALHIFQRLGAAETADVSTELDALTRPGSVGQTSSGTP